MYSCIIHTHMCTHMDPDIKSYTELLYTMLLHQLVHSRVYAHLYTSTHAITSACTHRNESSWG